MDDLYISAADEMQKAVAVVRQDLATIRTGRATPQLIENLMVEAYDTKMKLVELASITSPDPQTLIVTPFDQTNAVAIVKAIESAQMGLTPAIVENIIRVTIPPLSQERREEFVKLVRAKLEGGKVMVRQIRHKTMEKIQSGDFDEDTAARLEKEIQNATDKTVAEMDTLGEQKETELMAV